MSNIKDEHFFGRDHGEHQWLGPVPSNCPAWANNQPTGAKIKTTNQLVENQPQINKEVFGRNGYDLSYDVCCVLCVICIDDVVEI